MKAKQESFNMSFVVLWWKQCYNKLQLMEDCFSSWFVVAHET